jgi:CBS domain-containing protein
MATVRDILEKKGPGVHIVDPGATVLEAAQLMNDQRVGALVVADGEEVVGIFTERDVLRRVVAEQLNPGDVEVRSVMTSEVVCAEPQTTLDEARSVFMTRRIRHLPVVDPEGKLKGLISLGDLNAWQLDGQEVTIKYLHQYLYGVM